MDPRGIGPTKEKLDAIADELVVVPGDVQDATVQTALLLNSEDILAPQPYNRAIEDRFRRALHAKLETKPIGVTPSPQHGVILGSGDSVIQHTKVASASPI